MKRRSTAVRLAAVAATSAIVLTACGGNDDKDNAKDSNSDSPAASSTDSGSSAPSTALTDDKCAASDSSANAFRVGGILPITGTLSFLGPPEISGVGYAVSDINAAGGVNGSKACYDMQDSGDTTDLSISSNTADKLIQTKPSVVIGAASSSVTENVVQTFTDAKVVEISPANTATSLSGVSPYYFRTVTPDVVQGNALGSLITQDGYQKIAFLVFNDAYGTGLRDVVQKTVEGNGGECVYGCKGDGDEFPAAQTTFSSEVSAAIASNPDAIVVLAFDETKAIIPELNTQGFDMSKTYYSDGNTADYSKDLPKDSMTGAQGTIPGADASDEFKSQVSAFAELSLGKPLADYSYAAESYDGVILSALAAVKGGATDSETIRKNLPAVSGADGGEKCTSYADCVALLEDGQDIQYTGPSGIGPFNDKNDPSSGFVGIYQWDESNKDTLQTTIEGQS